MLIACVAVMISRPEPRGRLLAFYLGGLIASLTSGVVVLAYFDDGNTVLSSTSSTPSAETSIVAGLVSLLAWLMASHRGRALLDRWCSRHPRRHEKKQGPSWAELHLGRANARVAFVVGAAINLPGPFYLLALGDMATGGYSTAEQLGLIVLFNAITFLLVEVPLVGYLVQPEATAERVASFATWLNANGLRVMGCLVGVVGVGLIVQCLTAAASSAHARATQRSHAGGSRIAVGTGGFASAWNAAGTGPASAIAHLVDRDRQCQEQWFVLALPDLDAVGVADAQPLLRHGCHDVALALDLVLVIDYVAVRLEIVAVLDVDVEAVTDPHQRLVDRGERAAIALHLHFVAHGELLLLDTRHLVALTVLEDEGVTDP
jgi:hypothetical protein